MKKVFFWTVSHWNCLPDHTVHTSPPEHFRDHILPWTVSEVLQQFWWKGVASRDLSLRSQTHTSPSAQQLYTRTFLHYALSTAGTSTATGQQSSNLRKFDHTPKKKSHNHTIGLSETSSYWALFIIIILVFYFVRSNLAYSEHAVSYLTERHTYCLRWLVKMCHSVIANIYKNYN